MFSLVRTFLRVSPTRYVNPRQTNNFPSFLRVSPTRQVNPRQTKNFPFPQKPLSNFSPFFSKTLFQPIRTFSTLPNWKVDWNNLDKYTPEELPDPVSDDEVKAHRKIWEDLEKKLRDSDNDPATFLDGDLNEQDLPIYKLKQNPLPNLTEILNNNKNSQLTMARLMEEIKLYYKYSNFESVLNVFVEVRMNKLIPPLEMYEMVIPILLLLNDHDSINLLIEEMDSLGYRKGEKIYYTTLTMAMLEDDKPKVDQIWQEIINKKFEITPHIYKLVLGYLTTRTNLEDVVDWYRMMRKLGVIVDVNPASILLEMCRANKFYDFANEIITDTENDGLLLLDDVKDEHTYRYQDEQFKAYPKQPAIVGAHLLISEIFANQNNVEKSEEHLKKAKVMFNRHKNPSAEVLCPYSRLYESIILMHTHLKLWEKTRDLLKEMIDEGIMPSLECWRKIFICFLKNDQEKLFLKYGQHFENYGFEYDISLYCEQVAMWYRIGDHRRAKNAYNLVIESGSIPTVEAREAIIQVYAATGFPDDVQKFYEEQLRTGRSMSPIMHTVMIQDFLKRGKPELTQQVLQRMKNEGHPADLKTFVNVIRASVFQEIKKLIAEYVYGPKPTYPMNGEILTAIISKCPNLEDSFENWEKLASQVKLDAVLGQELIEIFGKFSPKNVQNVKNVALEVYEKTKQDWKFGPSDTPFFEAAIKSSYNIPQIYKILDDMKSFGIKKSRSVYRTVLAKCSELHRPRDALSFILDYLKQKDFIHVDVILSFFEVMVNNDHGQYREDAEKWIKVLLQSKIELLKIQEYEEEKGLLLPIQVKTIVGYIQGMSKYNIIPSWVYPIEEGLFQPTITDIEDILVHYGYKREEVQAVLAERDLVEALSVFKVREKEILEEAIEEKRVLSENVEKKIGDLAKIPSDLELWNQMMKNSMEKIFHRLRDKKVTDKVKEMDIIQALKRSFR